MFHVRCESRERETLTRAVRWPNEHHIILPRYVFVGTMRMTQERKGRHFLRRFLSEELRRLKYRTKLKPTRVSDYSFRLFGSH
jgi:hypothetical protein